MNAFRFPQPGERENDAAIPMPIHTLRALLAGALAWELDTNAAHPGLVPPELKNATLAALGSLDYDDAHAVSQLAERLMQDRADVEGGR